MVLLSIIQEASAGDDPVTAGQASFFGFIGIACALVFASKLIGYIVILLSNRKDFVIDR